MGDHHTPDIPTPSGEGIHPTNGSGGSTRPAVGTVTLVEKFSGASSLGYSFAGHRRAIYFQVAEETITHSCVLYATVHPDWSTQRKFKAHSAHMNPYGH